MNEALEVLDRLEGEYPSEGTLLGSQYDSEFGCIRGALYTAEKQAKALAILSEKRVSIDMLKNFDSYEDYNLYSSLPFLSKENYNLLKEVLFKK